LIVLKLRFPILKSHGYFRQFASKNLEFLVNFNFSFFVILKEFNRNHHLLLALFQSLDYVFLLFSNLIILEAPITFFKYQLF